MPSDPERTINLLGRFESAMPVYEYVCMSCESHFEELVRHDETPKCPDCGATKVQRQFSVFAAHGSSQPTASGAPRSAPFGGCGHGSCGCGGN
jgi:putative FmdB family regulatory protein